MYLLRLSALAATCALIAPPSSQAQSRAPAAQRAVEYEISFANAAHHEADVQATFAGVPRGGPLTVRMSRSSPGRYAVHEFAKNVYNVRAVDSRGRALIVTQSTPHAWSVSGHDGEVKFSYTLYADRADGTYAAVDRAGAHLNIPATFAWAPGLERRPVRVRFVRPDPSWTVATQLFATADSSVFTAPNLQYFMDSPTHLARISWHRWSVRSGGRDQLLRIALHHLGTADEETRYVDATKKIVDEQIRVFGALPAFDNGEYTFLSVYLPWASGDGMEHRNSTSLTNSGSLARSMTGLLGTVSHEFFHAWNVERMRPQTLEPFDFTEANMSDGLWLAEGFTSYYGPLTMKRAGVTTLDAFLGGAGGAANALVNTPGRRFHSAIQMSQQAPFVDAAVSIDPQNKPNTFLSYYTYGQAVALALDLSLRSRTPAVTLDDFMREMWKRHGAQRGYAPVKPYTMADVQAALAAVSDAAFAREFFSRYIAGRDAPPYADLMAKAGLLFRQADTSTRFLGSISLNFDGTRGAVSNNTIAGTPIYEAGVDRGDVIVSLGGTTITSQESFTGAVNALTPDQRVAIVFESRGQTVTSQLTVGTNPRMELVTLESTGGNVTAGMQVFRDAWLGKP